ncbi:kelch domain-containing protein 3-like [Leptinotarsa decemlineata]|uniref:kelch domain-containing protein 3-like n=1 Tax=Leptinotarsa decemlineata TaxID=7539 RepID=UPI003D30BD4B
MRWTLALDIGPMKVNHASVAVGNKIYTFGGIRTGEFSEQYSMDISVMDTETLRWTRHPVSDLPYFENNIFPYNRYRHTAIVYGDKVYIWGGRNNQASCSKLFCFDTNLHCWTTPKTTGNHPRPRDGHSASLWKNHMIIFGGFEEEFNNFTGSIYSLDLERMHWSCMQINGPQPNLRDYHTTVVIDDKIYMFGGRKVEMQSPVFIGRLRLVYCNTVWCLDPQASTSLCWQECKVTGDKPIGRRSHSSFVYNNKMYIFGGYNCTRGRHYNDMHEFDPKTMVWRELHFEGEIPGERKEQTCVVVGDRLFLFGGSGPEVAGVYDFREQLMDNTFVDYGDTFVLDFKPSLKTLCILAVKRYKLDVSILPENIRELHENVLI